ncbi:MAG: CDP-archaeol synthase, partial [Hyphomicrobiaceae bacterium]
LDFNLRWLDGRPLLGSSKTFRGLFASIVACLIGGYLLGVDYQSSIVLAVAAMLGDLFSSFLKRRLAIEPSGQAMGLDYVPEALFPALVLKARFEMSLVDVTIIVFGFWLAAAAISPLLHRIGVRDRPY